MDEPANRDESGRFPKGVSGNPNGRPKMDPEVREMLRAATPKAAQRLVEALDAEKYVGMDGHPVPDWKARTLAAETLFARLYGKPAQEVVGEDGGLVRLGVIVLPPESDE